MSRGLYIFSPKKWKKTTVKYKQKKATEKKYYMNLQIFTYSAGQKNLNDVESIIFSKLSLIQWVKMILFNYMRVLK